MLLYHGTICNEKIILQILKSGKLTPSKNTGIINESPNEEPMNHVYMNAISRKEIYKMKHRCGITFNINVLLNKTFYTRKHHGGNYANNCKTNDRNIIYHILYRLYRSSLKVINENNMEIPSLCLFQEVFTKSDISLKYAKYIYLPKNISQKVLKIINEKYPNMEIIFIK